MNSRLEFIEKAAVGRGAECFISLYQTVQRHSGLPSSADTLLSETHKLYNTSSLQRLWIRRRHKNK